MTVLNFNLHDSSLGRHVNAASRKSLEIQAYSITKPRTVDECDSESDDDDEVVDINF